MAHQDQKLATGRRWATVRAASFDALASVLPLPFEQFVLLLAADGRGASDHALRDACGRLLQAGARYVCVWGPDASRIHDICDQVALERGLNKGEAVVMTTWHDDEPLEEAVWFAANAAFPNEAFADAGEALVAIAIGSGEWESQIRQYLQDGTPMRDEA
jgi:hypothetical protein